MRNILLNINIKYYLNGMNKKTCLQCILLHFGVRLSFYPVFLALLHNHCYSFHGTK